MYKVLQANGNDKYQLKDGHLKIYSAFFSCKLPTKHMLQLQQACAQFILKSVPNDAIQTVQLLFARTKPWLFTKNSPRHVKRQKTAAMLIRADS